MADRVADRRQGRDDGRLAAASYAVRVGRVGHLDDLCVDHRQIRGDRDAVVQKSGVLEHAVAVVDVLLVQRPADALDGSALHLTFNVVWMDGLAGVLDRREAVHGGAAGLPIDLDVRHVHGERRAGTLSVQRRTTRDRAASAGRVAGQVGERQRLDVHVDAGHRARLAFGPLDLILVDPPGQRSAGLELADHVLARLDHRHAGGERRAAASRRRAIAGAVRVADADADALVGHAQGFRGHQRHGGAAAADVGAALDDLDHARIGDVDLGARLVPAVEPEPDSDAATFVLAQGLVVVGVRLGGVQAVRQSDRTERRAVSGMRALFRGVLEPEVDGVHAQLFREFVKHAFAGEHGLRRPRRAVGGHPRPVDDHLVALDEHVGHVVGRKHAHGTRAERAARIGAGFVDELRVHGDDGAVALAADLRGIDRAGRRAGGAEDVFASHHHLHRAAALLRQLERERLEVDGGLAAEAAADLAGDHADVAFVHAHRHRGH